MFDIGFTGVIQCDPKVCNKIKAEYKFVGSKSFEEMIKYKYLFDIVIIIFYLKIIFLKYKI